jgi:hypothetical protein
MMKNEEQLMANVLVGFVVIIVLILFILAIW